MQQVEARPQEAVRPRRGHASSTRSNQRRPSLSARSVNTLALSVSVQGKGAQRGTWLAVMTQTALRH